MDIHTTLISMPSYPSGTLERYASELQDTLQRDISNFLQQNHGIGLSGIKYLVLGLSRDHISLAAYQEMNMKRPYFNIVFEANSILLPIRESFFNMLLHLSFPTTLRQLRFVYPNDEYRQWNFPSLSPFFKALGPITTLCTSEEGLAYIIEQSDAEGVTLFESLKVVFLQDTISARRGNNPGLYLKHFFSARQHTAPIEILDLTESRKSFGDLRYLDDIVGLTVVLVSQGRTLEYVCGGGNPENLGVLQT
jgi:hypothetical protein